MAARSLRQSESVIVSANRMTGTRSAWPSTGEAEVDVRELLDPSQSNQELADVEPQHARSQT